MTTAPTYTWNNPAGGDFSTPTNWSGGGVPGAADDADLVGLGAPYTVTDSTANTLNGIQTAVGTTLAFSGEFHIHEINQGTDGGVSAGTVSVSDDTVVAIGGTFTNTGGIDLSDTTGNFFVGLFMDSGTVLDGGGTVSMGDEAPTANYRYRTAIGGTSSFINLNNTIVGAGFIGHVYALESNMVLTNEAAGVIDANGVNPLLISAGSETIVNAGLMEVTGTGGLVLYSAVDNSGTLAATGGAHFATLAIDGGVALTGGGIVTLNAKGVVEGFTTGAALTNVDNTITGGGFIASPLTLVNAAAGVIDADSGRMLINVAGTVTNAGLIEATGDGILLVSNTTIDSSSGGTVEAGKQIQLNKATLLGGSLDIEKGASLLSSTFASTINLEGGTVVNAGSLEGAGGGLTVDGDVANTGLVIAETGAITITGAIAGSGRIEVFGKQTLEVDGAVGGTVAFGAGSTGRLVLGDSAAFSGTITGFSRTGANSVDLKDIDFAQVGTPIYVANKNPHTGGVLTISNGSHTATLKLAGANYGGSTFELRADAGAGTIVVDPKVHAFVAAAAGLAPGAASGDHAGMAPRVPGPSLALAAPGLG